MSEATIESSGRVRVRAISFVSSALLVTLACTLLLLASRVTSYLDDQVVTGVDVLIEERPAPREVQRQAPRAGAPTANTAAPPMLTDIPIGRSMLARTLACFDNLHPERRDAECPPVVPDTEFDQFARLPVGGDFAGPPPLRLERIFTPAELATLMVDPPCVPGMTINNFMVQYCTRFGVTPPPPSRSAEQVCIDGGVGPCLVAEFRPEDVVRLAHTE